MKEKYHTPWNYGLTKETDERMRMYGRKISEFRTGKTWEEIMGEEVAKRRKQKLREWTIKHNKERIDLSKSFINRCKTCKKWFIFYKSDHPNRKFCSMECYVHFIPRKEVKCNTCGKVFKIIATEKRKFCSKRCFHKQPRWNKGLTREIDERVRRNAENTKLSYVNNPELRKLRAETFVKSNLGKDWEEKYGIEKSKTMKEEISKRFKNKKRPEHSKLMREKYEEGKWLPPMIKYPRSMNTKPNKPEKYLDNLIQTNIPNEFLYTGDGCKLINETNGTNLQPVVINGHIPDFINCNGKKKVIELFGLYWHLWKKQKEDPNYTKEQAEQEIKEDYKVFGFDCLVLWEDELRDEQKLLNKIKVFLNG